jgi:hypothetical protein
MYQDLGTMGRPKKKTPHESVAEAAARGMIVLLEETGLSHHGVAVNVHHEAKTAWEAAGEPNLTPGKYLSDVRTFWTVDGLLTSCTARSRRMC